MSSTTMDTAVATAGAEVSDAAMAGIDAQLERTAKVQSIINAILSSPSKATIQGALSDLEINAAALSDSGAGVLVGLLAGAHAHETAKELLALHNAEALSAEERNAIVEAIAPAQGISAGADVASIPVAAAATRGGEAGAVAAGDGGVEAAASSTTAINIPQNGGEVTAAVNNTAAAGATPNFLQNILAGGAKPPTAAAQITPGTSGFSV